MKKRAVFLVALAAVTGMLVSVAPPAQAGPYILKVHFICKEKKSGPLMYPSLQNSPSVAWSINCGKGKPKNPVGGNQHGLIDETFCKADIIPLNFLLAQPNKKPFVTKFDNKKPPPPKGIISSNCRINTKVPGIQTGPVVTTGPTCGMSSSSGAVLNVLVHTAPGSAAQKVFDVAVGWPFSIDGILPLTGTFTKKSGGGNGSLIGIAVRYPDRLHKNASCTPPGTTQFKIAGTIIGIGIKP